MRSGGKRNCRNTLCLSDLHSYWAPRAWELHFSPEVALQMVQQFARVNSGARERCPDLYHNRGDIHHAGRTPGGWFHAVLRGLASAHKRACGSVNIVHICISKRRKRATRATPCQRSPKDGYQAILKGPAGTRNLSKAASAGIRHDRVYRHDRKDAEFSGQWDAGREAAERNPDRKGHTRSGAGLTPRQESGSSPAKTRFIPSSAPA